LSRLLLGTYDAATATEPLRVSYSGPRSSGGGVLCLLDGHLDNAVEIAAELGGGAAEMGAPESLLAEGYRRWGRGLPGRMRGDFLLLAWDPEAREGLIARDQLGARPAYLQCASGVLRFANELPALLAMLPRRPEPDPASLAHWITASSRPGTQTLFSGVDRLGPGEMVVLGRSGARTVRYWEPRYEDPLEVPADELVERVRDRLRVAVSRRLAPDAPTAVLLSGGLDSSAVAAIAVAEGGDRVRACSASFPDHPMADEAELIAGLRESLGLRGPAARVRASGLLASAREHVEAQGVPLLSWGDFWTLPLMRAAAGEGVANVLGGDGGDELFGPRQNSIAEALRRGHPLRAAAIADTLPGAGPHVPRREVGAMLASQALIALPLGSHRRLQRWRARRREPAWLRPLSARALRESDDPLAWKRLEGPLWWSEIAYGVAYGLDEMGIFEHQRRRAAMAGVEARHPLLDLDLVALCLRQPPAATLDRRFSRPVLRESVAGLVPDAVRLRPGKARFESLVISCLTGAEMPQVRALLLDPEAKLRAYLDQEEMKRELFEGSGDLALGSFQWMWQVWRLLTAELWLRSEASPSTRIGRLYAHSGGAQPIDDLQLFPDLTACDKTSRISRNLMIDTLNRKRSSRQ
jgi:asparagine synthase (glutamine-hydrolysing)